MAYLRADRSNGLILASSTGPYPPEGQRVKNLDRRHKSSWLVGGTVCRRHTSNPLTGPRVTTPPVGEHLPAVRAESESRRPVLAKKWYSFISEITQLNTSALLVTEPPPPDSHSLSLPTARKRLRITKKPRLSLTLAADGTQTPTYYIKKKPEADYVFFLQQPANW